MSRLELRAWALGAALLISLVSPARAADIGVGADGSVWVVTPEEIGPGGNRIFRWQDFAWADTDGQAVKVDVGPDGRAWIVDLAGTLSRLEDPDRGAETAWEEVRKDTWDVGVGADGSVWILALEPPPAQVSGGMTLGEGDFRVYQATLDGNGQVTGWTSVPGGGAAIDVDPTGTPWVVAASGGLFRYDAGSQAWTQVEPATVTQAVDVGIGGQAQGAGSPSVATAAGLVQRCAQAAGGKWSCAALEGSPGPFAGQGDLRLSAGVEAGFNLGDVPWVVAESGLGVFLWHQLPTDRWVWEDRSLSLELEAAPTLAGQGEHAVRAAARTLAAGPVTCALGGSQRLDDVFQKMSHNTYANSPAQPVSALADALDSGVRAIEIDIYDTVAINTPWGGNHRDWYVRHGPVGGNNNHCGPQGQGGNLSVCLDDLRSWHDAHPNHDLVTVFIDKKQGWSDRASQRTPADLDGLIVEKIGGENFFLPAQLLGRYPSLSVAALADAWPTRDAVAGKFLFLLTGGDLKNAGGTMARYLSSRSTADAVLFACPDVDSGSDLVDQGANVVCSNFTYRDLVDDQLGRTSNALRRLSHVWDLVESALDRSYQQAIAGFGNYIGLDDYHVTTYNGGRMSGGFWCQGREPWTFQPVASEGGPQHGQKHRSSDNFDLKAPAGTRFLLWMVGDSNGPRPAVSFRLMKDSVGWDFPALAGEIGNGTLSPVPSRTTKLYIADPEGTGGSAFQVAIVFIF